MSKELRRLFSRHGITDWAHTSSGHIKARVAGCTIVCSSSPSHQRAIKEVEGDIRRAVRLGSVR